MTENRRKEIALMIVEQRIMEGGIPSVDALRRDVGNLAKKIGIETEELLTFYQGFFPRLYARIFGYSSVSIHAEGRQ